MGARFSCGAKYLAATTRNKATFFGADRAAAALSWPLAGLPASPRWPPGAASPPRSSTQLAEAAWLAADGSRRAAAAAGGRPAGWRCRHDHALGAVMSGELQRVPDACFKPRYGEPLEDHKQLPATKQPIQGSCRPRCSREPRSGALLAAPRPWSPAPRLALAPPHCMAPSTATSSACCTCHVRALASAVFTRSAAALGSASASASASTAAAPCRATSLLTAYSSACGAGGQPGRQGLGGAGPAAGAAAHGSLWRRRAARCQRRRLEPGPCVPPPARQGWRAALCTRLLLLQAAPSQPG
jgi:hypothetical protein